MYLLSAEQRLKVAPGRAQKKRRVAMVVSPLPPGTARETNRALAGVTAVLRKPQIGILMQEEGHL